MKTMNNTPIPITTAEGGMLLSIIVPIILYLLGRAFDKKKYSKETEKIDAESEVTRATAKKVESEAAQTLITSASTLVEEYREMLDSLNKKYTALDERLKQTEQKLEDEIRKRARGEQVTLELYRGFNEVIEQLHDLRIEPRWKPDERLKVLLAKLEEELK